MNLQEEAYIRKRLVAAAVRHLKDLNFRSVTAELLVTDRLYMAFFRSFMDELKGKSPNVDEVIIIFTKELE